MWLEIESEVKNLDNRINEILEEMPKSAYENVDSTKDFPLLYNLPSDEYNNLKNRIVDLRSEILDLFVNGNSELRTVISNFLKKYPYFEMVFVPNKSAINNVSNKEEYLLNILIAISVQNLNGDIRDLILFLNSLKYIALEYNIDFNNLLKKVIGISSDLPDTYTISMKDFFEYYLNEKSIPI